MSGYFLVFVDLHGEYHYGSELSSREACFRQYLAWTKAGIIQFWTPLYGVKVYRSIP